MSRHIRIALLAVLLLLGVVPATSAQDCPTPTPVPTATDTPTPEPTPTNTPLPTATATATPAPNPLTFYVSPTGSDTNTGSEAAPWHTLSYAFSQLDPGETLLVRGGTDAVSKTRAPDYVGDFIYTRVGTATAPITVAAYPGETPIIEPASREPLRVKGTAAYTTFRGLAIQKAKTGSNYQNVYVLEQANHITFERDLIRWALEGSGVFVDDTTNHIDFIANRVYENNGLNQHQGIYHEGDDSVIARNVVYGHTNGFGIQVKTGANNVVVAQNTTADNHYSGIVIMDTATNTRVVNNISAFNGDYGIRGFDDSPGGTIGTNTSNNNLLYGNGAGTCANQKAGIIACGTQLPSADPQFVNRVGRDYRIASTSPAVDQAIQPWTYLPDASGGGVQGFQPDVGAYEGG